MNPFTKVVLYGSLVLFAIAGYALEQIWNIDAGTWISQIAGCLILLAIALLEAVLPNFQSAREERAAECNVAWERINKEESNYRQIVNALSSGKTFGGYHQRAVEQYSYELTKKAIKPLSSYWKYWLLVRSIINEIDKNFGKNLSEMQVERLIALMDKLKNCLAKELKLSC